MSRSQVEFLASLALLCVVAGILIAVLLPAGNLGASEGRLRSLSEAQSWLVHGALFATLGLTVGFRLAASEPTRFTLRWVVTAAVLVVVFATLSELAQLRVDGRNAAFGDWVADLVGTASGLLIASALGPPTIAWLVRPRAV
jgi:FtsH-binding integral membrane protein